MAVDPMGFQVVQNEILQRVVAENGGENDIRARRAQMLRHHRGSAREVHFPFMLHTERRRLRGAANERAISVGIDNGVADDMDLNPLEFRQSGLEIAKIEPFRMEKRQELLHGQVGRRGFDNR